MLQQCLPLAVLKPSGTDFMFLLGRVATVLTACGIETVVPCEQSAYLYLVIVATVLTACGIETYLHG